MQRSCKSWQWCKLLSEFGAVTEVKKGLGIFESTEEQKLNMLYYTLRTYEHIDLLLPFEEWGGENEAMPDSRYAFEVPVQYPGFLN